LRIGGGNALSSNSCGGTLLAEEKSRNLMEGNRGWVLHSPPDILSAHNALLFVLELLNVVYGEHSPCVFDLCFVFGGDLVLLREFAPSRFGGLLAG
jgi:hypothetical protein